MDSREARKAKKTGRQPLIYIKRERPCEAALFYMCGVGWERQPSVARVQQTSISNRLLRVFSLFPHILVTCDDDAATMYLDSNPIFFGERITLGCSR